MAIGRAGVVGCGLMGGGIAQTCAQSGWENPCVSKRYCKVHCQFLAHPLLNSSNTDA